MNGIWFLLGGFAFALVSSLIYFVWTKTHTRQEETLTLTQCTITQLSKFAAESHWLELYRVISGTKVEVAYLIPTGGTIDCTFEEDNFVNIVDIEGSELSLTA